MSLFKNVVLSGDFLGSEISTTNNGLSIIGTDVVINKDTIDRYFILEDESETGSDFQTDFLTGWYKTLTNQSKVIIRISFKNGNDSIIQISKRIFEKIKNYL